MQRLTTPLPKECKVTAQDCPRWVASGKHQPPGLVSQWDRTARFFRTGRMLDDPELHSTGGARAELILSIVLVPLVAGFSTYLGLG